MEKIAIYTYMCIAVALASSLQCTQSTTYS